MTPIECLLWCSVLAVLVSIAWWWVDTRLGSQAKRFRLKPRVGDKAGYVLWHRSQNAKMWVVGEVVVVKTPPFVELEVVFVTATGGVTRRDTWSTADLRYFPPETPIGTLELSE